MKTSFLSFGTALALLTILGCNSPETRVRRSSLMDYLYPKQKEAPAPNPAGARLKLPMRLGVAFVPGTTARGAFRVFLPRGRRNRSWIW